MISIIILVILMVNLFFTIKLRKNASKKKRIDILYLSLNYYDYFSNLEYSNWSSILFSEKSNYQPDNTYHLEK